MKKQLIRSLQVCALLIALAIPSLADESRRGFYEGNLAGGGKVVFFVQGNHALSTYVFDTAGQQASFGGGTIAPNGTFTLTLTPAAAGTVTGTVDLTTVVATLLGQSVTADRVPTFGESEHMGGRFTATAISNTGAAYDIKVVVDAQKNIFLVAKQGATVLGGFGLLTPSPSATPGGTPGSTPSATPFATPSATPHGGGGGGGGGDDDPPGDDDHGHGHEGSDEQQDHHLDDNSHEFSATFAMTFVTGEAVTGHLNASHGLLLGDFTLNGVVYRFRAPRESSEHHLANIATRAFVSTGQGRLIGGFIIRGGPKLVLIRAIGPSLAAAGVNPVLANPQVELFDGSTSLALNDNWQSAPNAAAIAATTIAPQDPNEAAILIRLEPGSYTTVVSGVNDGTGISLVEVYGVDRD